MLPDRDETDLEDMNPTVHKDLIFELNKNLAWKSIATYMVKTNPHDSNELIDHLEQKANMPNAKKTAAEFLWSELLRRNWDIQRLSNALRACELWDALYILEGREDLVITRQPNLNMNEKPYRLRVGDTFSITCTATGIPPPKYQWMFGKHEITGQTSSDLNLLITSPDQEGDYQCEVSHYNRHNERVGQVCSTSVPVRIEPTPVKIVESLAADYKVKIGEKLTLSCVAEGHPIPKYQWYRNDELLHKENKNILQIANVTCDDEGEYRCLASNGSFENSTKTRIKVDYGRRKPTAKIALLIANSDYTHHKKLLLVKNDVELISSRLKETGFHVMCWQNLTLKEMKDAMHSFRKLLKRGCYAVFYYAGHGFKMQDRCLMPVDTPKNCCYADTVRESEVLRYSLKPKPELFFGIFDMCLTIPSRELYPKLHKENIEVVKYKSVNNLIMAFPTCDHKSSPELESEKNGIYVPHLSKYLNRDIPISEVIQNTERSLTEKYVTASTEEYVTDLRASPDSEIKEPQPMHIIKQREPYCYLTDSVMREISGNPTVYVTFLDKLTKFDPKTVPLKMKQCEVECQVTVQLLKPYWNVVEISVSGLEDWDVEFKNRFEKTLHATNKGCVIYNPQRIAASTDKDSLTISIGKNGNLCGSGQLEYMEHLPKTLVECWQGGR